MDSHEIQDLRVEAEDLLEMSRKLQAESNQLASDSSDVHQELEVDSPHRLEDRFTKLEQHIGGID